MSAVPARSNQFFQRNDDRDSQINDLEQRLEKLQEKILADSTQRVHDFERRLEHEWIALRQLHEESLKSVEQRTLDIAGSCVSVVHETLAVLRAREESVRPVAEELPAPRSHAATMILAVALGAVTVFGAYTAWRLTRELDAMSARAASSETRLTELRQFVERQTRETNDSAQRLTADALTTATKAERLAGVLAAVDLKVFPVRGQAAAAAAAGQVFFSPTRGIALSASRVSRLPSNQTYQVWMTTSRGPLSLGFAEPDGQGRMDAAFEAPPELPSTVIGFMLTIEPTGGSDKPTGAVALTS